MHTIIKKMYTEKISTQRHGKKRSIKMYATWYYGMQKS